MASRASRQGLTPRGAGHRSADASAQPSIRTSSAIGHCIAGRAGATATAQSAVGCLGPPQTCQYLLDTLCASCVPVAEDRAPTPSIPGPSLIPNADPSSRPQPIPSPSKDNAPIPVQGTASSAADAREVYVSPSKDYSVQVPTAWERKDKAGGSGSQTHTRSLYTCTGITCTASLGLLDAHASRENSSL